MPLLLPLLPWILLAKKLAKVAPPLPEPRKRYIATIAFASSTSAVSRPHVLDMRPCKSWKRVDTCCPECHPYCWHTFKTLCKLAEERLF